MKYPIINKPWMMMRFHNADGSIDHEGHNFKVLHEIVAPQAQQMKSPKAAKCRK
jgi:hypothetical protein